MLHCHTNIETQNASKYLQQLCKHFRHKVTVEYDKTFGRVEFPGGLCLMTADQTVLSFYCKAQKPEGVGMMQSVLDQHLVKFAWREELNVTWQDGLPDPLPANPSLVEIN